MAKLEPKPLPCPKCGKEVHVSLTGFGMQNWLELKPECGCFPKTQSKHYFIDDEDSDKEAEGEYRHLVEAWNRKVEVAKGITAKEFLKQYRLCDIQIRNLLEQRERLESIREKVTTSWGTERVSGSCNNDKMADTTAKILAMEKELDSEVDVLKAKMKEVNDVLGKITDETHLDLLSKVYISYESLERTACEMGYTYRNACYIHGRALQTVEAILAERKVDHG